MKKVKKISIVFLMLMICMTNIFAEVATEERTESNLLVGSHIKVTSSNKQAILNTPKVNEEEKVYDFADLLTDSEEADLKKQLSEYIYKTNYDACIVTINDNNKSSTKMYAADFYDYNYFGEAPKHDGICFVIDMDNREIAMITTGDARLMYTDKRIKNITDTCASYLSEEKYYNGLVNSIAKVSSYYTQGRPSSSENYEIDDYGNEIYNLESESSGEAFLIVLLISASASLVITLIFLSKHKQIRKKYDAQSYLEKNKLDVTKQVDAFLTTHTTKIKIENNSGGSGSSSFSGSSGISHGGGSSRF